MVQTAWRFCILLALKYQNFKKEKLSIGSCSKEDSLLYCMFIFGILIVIPQSMVLSSRIQMDRQTDNLIRSEIKRLFVTNFYSWSDRQFGQHLELSSLKVDKRLNVQQHKSYVYISYVAFLFFSSLINKISLLFSVVSSSVIDVRSITSSFVLPCFELIALINFKHA